jgi:hypothetical protein
MRGCFLQESHSSRLEKRKKEAAASEAMAEEMVKARAKKEQEAAAAAAAEAAKLTAQRSVIATPGRDIPGRRATTPRRPTFL